MKNSRERITVILDSDVVKALRKIQAKRIRDEQKSVSFSSVIDNELRKVLKL